MSLDRKTRHWFHVEFSDNRIPLRTLARKSISLSIQFAFKFGGVYSGKEQPLLPICLKSYNLYGISIVSSIR